MQTISWQFREAKGERVYIASVSNFVSVTRSRSVHGGIRRENKGEKAEEASGGGRCRFDAHSFAEKGGDG